jgi:wyosine [tRNA(Phe)-imidazoG37] synthetase (radical SAM superfamily)
LQPEDKPDFLTFVANGEPTLDKHLGREITLLQPLGIPVAVITNASLLSDHEVRKDLSLADWVSVKVDTGNAGIRNALNRPLHGLDFLAYVEGLLQFTSGFTGHLVTETMLVNGVNDAKDQLMETVQLVLQLNPSRAYISVPTRPPAVRTVKSPPEESLLQAYRIFSDAGLQTELITGFEGIAVCHTGNVRNDLLHILAVHPLREDAVRELLRKNNSDWSVVEDLIRENLIRRVNYQDYAYYLRKYSGD